MFIKGILSKGPGEPGNFASERVKHSKKKLFILTAIVTVAIICVAFLVPQALATIPLKVDYVVGEKMVYSSTITSTLKSYGAASESSVIDDSPKSTHIEAQEIIDVIGLESEYYLLNHTVTMSIKDKPFSISLTEKMNKTGYSTYFFGNTETELSNTNINSASYLSQLLTAPEVKVGDTITVPYPSISPGIEMSGLLTITFRGIEDLTVPAGTYKVIRIDMTSSDVSIHLPSNSALNISNGIEMNYQVYLEYGTLRQIKSSMQETVTLQSPTINATTQITNDMILNQHIKP